MGGEHAKQIKNSSLLRTDNYGHTSYVTGTKCVVNTVNNYLLKGTTPGKDVSCLGTANTPVPTKPTATNEMRCGPVVLVSTIAPPG